MLNAIKQLSKQIRQKLSKISLVEEDIEYMVYILFNDSKFVRKSKFTRDQLVCPLRMFKTITSCRINMPVKMQSFA